MHHQHMGFACMGYYRLDKSTLFGDSSGALLYASVLSIILAIIIELQTIVVLSSVFD
jgi:hypothetical protein